MSFDLKKLLTDVFAAEAGEVVTVACDLPHTNDQDTAAWQERRDMARGWRDAFAELGGAGGFTVNPLLTFSATGAHGAELPVEGEMDGRTVNLEEVLLGSTLAVFMTQYSATAALDGYCRKKIDFRAASMPGVMRRMEQTALAADYEQVAKRCALLAQVLEGAQILEVEFSTGHVCRFDLRFRNPEVDDGMLPRGKEGDRIINLPSGETFIVPYEGERPDQPSLTAGEIPMVVDEELMVLRVAENRVVEVSGEGPAAAGMREFFAADPARANIAEVAFGCNDRAVVTGVVIEDEKAGFHWAYGRSDHLGGTVGVAAFSSAAMVVHQDIVYAEGNPVQVARAEVTRNGQVTQVMADGRYLLWE